MLLSIGPDYFSPSEVAWKFQSYNVSEQDEDNYSINEKADLGDMIDLVLARHVPAVIPPHTSVSGYVFTYLDPGV